MKILLIEDSDMIIKGLKYSLLQNGYEFNYCKTNKDATTYLNSNKEIDLIILDITLPDGNGFRLYQNVISRLNIPTIFLTAKDEEDDIVKGLNMGAEDYITKPFSTKELMARINKIFLRTKKTSIIRCQNISFDMEQMVVKKDNKLVPLTPLELKLLQLLFLNINKVVERKTIINTIWDITGNDVDDHTITVYFKRIREKLGTNIITTIKGIGYEIKDEK